MPTSIYHLRPHHVLTLCVLGLLGLGVVMVASASMRVAAPPAQPIAEPVNGYEAVTGLPAWRWNNYATRHVIYAGLAVLTFFAAGSLDYRRLVTTGAAWRQPALWLLGIATVACVLVLIPGIGREVNGARRWLSLGITQVQPSELGKWAIVLFLAWWLALRPVRIENLLGFLATALPLGLVSVLIVLEDFGTAALIALAAVLILLAGRARLWHLALIIPPVLAAGYWFVRHKEYRWRRLVAFVDPWASPDREGYHIIQSLMSFAGGGLLGRGLGQGVQKLGYLPEDTTDFIFSVICEELGLFGGMLTIALYLGILAVAWQAARRARDDFGRLLAFGVGITISLQALLNIAVATVSMPTKGMSLPLVSFGGSGLIITSAALGLLYSICRVTWAAAPQLNATAAVTEANLAAAAAV